MLLYMTNAQGKQGGTCRTSEITRPTHGAAKVKNHLGKLSDLLYRYSTRHGARNYSIALHKQCDCTEQMEQIPHSEA